MLAGEGAKAKGGTDSGSPALEGRRLATGERGVKGLASHNEGCATE